MPLSKGSQGYQVAGSKPRPASVARPFPKGRVPAIYAEADNKSIDPQFSEFSSIKKGGSGSQPSQPRVGYHRAD